jgi:hypothetical protein
MAESPTDQHPDLAVALATILARTHQLAQWVWRSPGLSQEERAVLLDGLFTIEAAARLMRHRLAETSAVSPSAGTAVSPPAAGEV